MENFRESKETENGYLVQGENGAIKLIFLTDDIIRIRVSFDRIFKEASYALVTTAWEDELDGTLKEERQRIAALALPYEETEEQLVFRTKTLCLVMQKNPLNFRLYDKEGNLIYADLKERAFDKDQLGRITHYSSDMEKDHFYGFGENTGHLDKEESDAYVPQGRHWF